MGTFPTRTVNDGKGKVVGRPLCSDAKRARNVAEQISGILASKSFDSPPPLTRHPRRLRPSTLYPKSNVRK